MTTRRAILALVAAALLAPSPASAATTQQMSCAAIPPGLSGTLCNAVGPSYEVVGTVLYVYGGSGSNDIAFTERYGVTVVTIGARQTPALTWRPLGAATCTIAGTRLECPSTLHLTDIEYSAIPQGPRGSATAVAYGPAADTITGDSTFADISVYSGGGNDTVTLNGQGDTVDGGAGADRLSAGNIVYGDLDLASTRVSGGWTRVARTSPVTVALSGSSGTGGSSADDGSGDTIVKAGSSVTGTAAGDLMTANGSTAPPAACSTIVNPVPELHGGPGNDVLRGGVLFGDAGNDTLTVTTRATRGVGMVTSLGSFIGQLIDGGPGNDTLQGNGPVVIRGGTGADYMSGAGALVDYTHDAGRTGEKVIANTGDAKANDGSSDDRFSASQPTVLDTIAPDVTGIVARAGSDELTATIASTLFASKVVGSEQADQLEGHEVYGNGGDDVLRGDIVHGGNGNDSILGSPVQDELYGDAGSDSLDGSAGADLLSGGGDAGDTVYYGRKVLSPGVTDGPQVPRIFQPRARSAADSCASTPPSGPSEVSYERTGVTVTLDSGAGNDGGLDDVSFGQRDTVTGVARVYGTQFGDTVTGASQRDEFMGRGGDDVFTGGPGSDRFVGGDGSDTMSYAERSSAVRVQLGSNVANGDTITDGSSGDDIGIDVERSVGGSGDDVMYATNADRQELLDGGDGADQLYASDGPDTLIGGNGFDTVNYGARTTATAISPDGMANDGAAGEADNVSSTVESFVTGSGNDTVAGSAADNLFRTGAGADSVDGAGGTDLLCYDDHPAGVVVDLTNPSGPNGNASDGAGDHVVGISKICGTEGDDVLTGDATGNDLIGAGGNDTLRGGGGRDAVIGGDGNDVLDGGTGNDIVSGGPDVDIAEYTGRSEAIIADLDGADDDDGGPSDGASGARDSITASVEGVRGGTGDDTLTGNSGANTLDGGPGNDTLDGLGGADTFMGGTGTDVVTYASRTAAVTASIPDGTATADDGEVGEGDAIGNDVENLTGGTGADTLTGNGQGNVLLGGLGGDTLVGNGGVDSTSYADRSAAVTATIGGGPVSGVVGEGDNLQSLENLTGGTGNDTLSGDGAANRLDGGAGDDQLFGNGGADDLVGGSGANDVARYDTRTTSVTASLIGVSSTNGGIEDGPVGARDTIEADVEGIIGGTVADTLTGDESNNTLYGNAGNDSLTGNDGDDQFAGGDGADTVSGGNGSDGMSYYLVNQPVTADLDSEVGDDGSSRDGAVGARDTLLNIENIVGGNAGNTLTGNAFDNGFTGGDGADTFNGGDGNDSFVGGNGADVFNGGPGVQDIVQYTGRTTSVTADIDGVAGDDGGTEDGSPGSRDTIASDIEGITGGNGADTLTGDGNKNYLTGGPGADTLFGLDDADVIFARDGVADTIDCGNGSDNLQSDAFDVGAVSCEANSVG